MKIGKQIRHKNKNITYFRDYFPRKLFVFESNLMYCDLWLQHIQVRKLFKGGNYSKAETIRGNTVGGKVMMPFFRAM